jgi:hypothetical protein
MSYLFNNNSTANSPRRSPRRPTSSALSSTVCTLQLEEEVEEEHEELDELVGEDNVNLEQQSQPYAFKPAKIFCDLNNCPGRGHHPAQTCFFCEADIECFLGTVHRLKEYPDDWHD